MTIENFLNSDLSLKEIVEVNSKSYEYQGLINKYDDIEMYIYVHGEADDDDTIIVNKNLVTGETTLAE
jgi:hypothetical protein